ncbi:MAG: glycosyltransferase family 2 protein [Chitinophagaceae bacterium]|nr:glycosyltransferase family 2 protein [Chitinophagaceae bacterium]
MEEKNKLSILIACYNEEKTIIAILEKIFSIELTGNTFKEVIAVDDASTDQTYNLLTNYLSKNQDYPLQVYRQERNSGKGACISLAANKATGNIIVIQDADLEYNPENYNDLLKPIIDGFADVVYGSRFIGNGPHRVLFFSHTLGNKLLTFLSNLFTQINLTDMETGYKMFRSEILKKISISEKRFGFEPEVTAKIANIPGIRIYEVGISYYGRTYKDGKKIRWTDGVHALWCIAKYNIFKRK